MSSTRILFFGPVPFIKVMFTPKFLANFLVDGDACDDLSLLTKLLSPTGNGVYSGFILVGGS